jgi:hypothetical protein
MRIIDRAIQRVNIPAAARLTGMTAALFSNDAILWKPAPDFTDQERFGAAINFRNQIDFTFMINLQALVAPGA